LVTLMYQSSAAAQHSYEEHAAILEAIEQHNTELALERMDAHLCNVEKSLALDSRA
jgi:DNA-binding GntR family transcriptional regulator